MNDQPIRARVAHVLTTREIAINAGENQGVAKGMIFDVMDTKGEDITDPETGEILGSIERRKIRVKIIQVQEKLSVASTYRTKKTNIGGSGSILKRFSGNFSDLEILSRSMAPPKYITKYETFKTDEKTWEDLDEAESYVKTGDPVVQVLDTELGDKETEQKT